MRRVKLALGLAVLGVGAAACGGSRSDARALTVVRVLTPRLEVRRYDTSGAYPQVRGAGVDLRAVKGALRGAVLRAQRAYARDARREVAEVPSPKGCRGVYQTWVRPRLMSASTVVVSALVPTLELYPCGNDGATWISATIRVPSGKSVAVTELFASPRGLRALASAVRRQILSGDACVRDSQRNEKALGLAEEAQNLDASPAHYRYFALTVSGLAVGFPISTIGAPSCNRVETTVPYAVVRPYLSELGRQLVAGVRRPRFG